MDKFLPLKNHSPEGRGKRSDRPASPLALLLGNQGGTRSTGTYCVGGGPGAPQTEILGFPLDCLWQDLAESRETSLWVESHGGEQRVPPVPDPSPTGPLRITKMKESRLGFGAISL